MADLVITAASVLADSSARVTHGKAGASITAGQAVYLDTATSSYKLADSNGAAAAKRPKGIALHAAASGQPLAIIENGPLTAGATLAPGATYYLSDTPGGICPFADVGSGEDAVKIGVAASSAVLKVGIEATGATL